MAEQPVEESVAELPEESKQEVASSVSGSLKSKRNLVPSKMAVTGQEEAPAAQLDAQDELARLKAELEREKAEKAKLTEEMAL